MADIFLSHSSADNDAADQIKSWLERDRESWSVFLDKHSRDGILAGQGWQDRLRGELQSCRLVLAIITEDWLASRWCFTEAVTATFRGKDLVGVVPGDLPDGALDVAPPIVHERQRQPLDLATGAGWEELLHALDRSGLDPSQWFSIPEGVGPYPGFVAFEEKDAGVFFGRDQEITEYLDALNLLKAPNRAQALVISGGSGSGKSSLLKAGLNPRLRRQPDWLIVPPFDPSREPIHALFSALRAAAQATGADIDLPPRPPQTVEALTELLQDSLRAIEDKANAWLLLPLDQAEILLASSQEGSETDASHLLAAVGRLLASRTRKLVAVLTIRTEFIPALDRALPSEVRLHDRSLRSITALSEIIEKPAARFGIQLEEGLTGRMVEDARGAGALPLLAYTLRELNEKFGDDNLLTVAEYEQLGGVEGAIEKKLLEALSDPEPTADELAAFRRCFVRQLVRVDESAVEGERYLRTAVARDVLPDAAVRLVERLTEARLLVEGDDGAIGIAHERLIRNWADVPLVTWLAEDSDDRKLIDTLNSFLAAHHDGGPLLSEKPLRDAVDLLSRDTALESDRPDLAKFIEDSLSHERELIKQEMERREREAKAERDRLEAEARAAAEREAAARKITQRTRVGAVVAVCLAIVAGAIGYFAYEKAIEAEKQSVLAKDRQLEAEKQTLLAEQQRDVAEEERARARSRLADALAARASAEPKDSYDAMLRRVYLAAHSLGIRWTPEGMTACLSGLIRLPRPVRSLWPDTSRWMTALALSDDDRWVAAADSVGRTAVYDTLTGELVHRISHDGDHAVALAFSPNRRLLAVAGYSRTEVWDTADWRPVTREPLTLSPGTWGRVGFTARPELALWVKRRGRTALSLSGEHWEQQTEWPSPNLARVLLGDESQRPSVTDLDTSQGSWLAMALGKGGFLLVDPTTHTVEAASKKGDVPAWLHRVAISGAGNFVAAAGQIGDRARLHWTEVRGHDPSFPVLGTWNTIDWLPFGGDIDPMSQLFVASLSFSHDGRYLSTAVVDSRGSSVGMPSRGLLRLWDLAAKNQNEPVAVVFPRDTWHSVFAKEGSQLITAGRSVWSWALSGAVVARRRQPGTISDAAFSLDGRYLASASGRSLWVLESDTWRRVAWIELDDPIRALRFSDEGRTLLVENPLGEVVVDTSSWRTTSAPDRARVAALSGRKIAESPDGRLLAARSATDLAVVQKSDLHELARVPFAGDAYLSPRQAWVVAVDKSQWVVFRASDGQVVRAHQPGNGHDLLGFDRDARWLVTRASEKEGDTIRVVSTRDWTAARDIKLDVSPDAVDISPDGAWLRTEKRVLKDRGRRGRLRDSFRDRLHEIQIRIWSVGDGSLAASESIVETSWKKNPRSGVMTSRAPGLASGRRELLQLENWSQPEKGAPFQPRAAERSSTSFDGEMELPIESLAGWTLREDNDSSENLGLEHGRLQIGPLRHADYVDAITVDTNGRWLVTIAGDTLYVRPLGRDELIDAACTRVRFSPGWSNVKEELRESGPEHICEQPRPLIAAARDRARHHDLEAAVELFRRASVSFNAKDEARRLAADELVRRAFELLLAGQRDKAGRLIARAHELDSDLDSDLEAKLERATGPRR